MTIPPDVVVSEKFLERTSWKNVYLVGTFVENFSPMEVIVTVNGTFSKEPRPYKWVRSQRDLKVGMGIKITSLFCFGQ